MPGESITAKPVLLRADLTPDEWTRLRVACLKEGTSPRRVLTEYLRGYIDKHEGKGER